MDVIKYVATCGVCQHVKVELQSLKFPLGPWDGVNVDSVVGMPCVVKVSDSIIVVMDLLCKVAHFTSIQTTNSACDLARVYMKVLFGCMGYLTIVFDRDIKFVSKFWYNL